MPAPAIRQPVQMSAQAYLQNLMNQKGEAGVKEFVGNQIYQQVLTETNDEK
jgi:hypothetical protein